MGSKHRGKSLNRIWGIGIPYLLMTLLSCHSFVKNINSVVILKCAKRMLEYNFSKVFDILECNDNNLEKPPNKVKQRIHAEETDNSDDVMKCINKTPHASDTLKNLLGNKSLHPSYIQREFNEK